MQNAKMRERRSARSDMTSTEKYEMNGEQRISMREEQVLLCPEKGRTKVISQETVRDIQEAQTHKMEKLMALLRELGGNKFFGKLLIKYESGHIVLVKKTQYIRLSRGSPGEGSLDAAQDKND
jgi:hypothetical protein